MLLKNVLSGNEICLEIGNFAKQTPQKFKISMTNVSKKNGTFDSFKREIFAIFAHFQRIREIVFV